MPDRTTSNGQMIVPAERGYFRLLVVGVPGEPDALVAQDGIVRLPVVAWSFEDIGDPAVDHVWIASPVLPFEAHLTTHQKLGHLALKTPDGVVIDEEGSCFDSEDEWLSAEQAWIETYRKKSS